MKVEIFLTTCKRAEWCLWMLKDIQRESQGVNYNIRVFHDEAFGDNYSKVIDYCKQYNNLYYYRVKYATGKDEYWVIHKYMHELADTLAYDYMIMLQDDMALVENFTQRAVNVLGGKVEVCSLFPTNLLHKLSQEPPKPLKNAFTYNNSAELEILNGVLMRSTNWSDCCYVATKAAMQGITITPPTAKYKSNPTHGSGVTYSFIREYNQKTGKRIYQLEYGLVQHLGFYDSAMFGEREEMSDNPLDRDNPWYIHLTDQDYYYTLKKVTEIIVNKKYGCKLT
jgi:hypothetical protein